MEQLTVVKEEAIRLSMELKVECHGKEMAQSKGSELMCALKVAQESMDVANETCRQLKEERIELLRKIQRLEEQVQYYSCTICAWCVSTL